MLLAQAVKVEKKIKSCKVNHIIMPDVIDRWLRRERNNRH